MVADGSEKITFGNQTTVQGDVFGGNKYDIKFYVLASISRDGKVDWSKYRQQRQTQVEEPYKFLSYYETIDADIFFGREVVSNLLCTKISNHKLVLINGKSGSGKTSLINAGIIPLLVAQGYFTMVFRDYGYPTATIKAGLTNLKDTNIDLSNSNTLLDCLRTTIEQTERPVAIFLDQFERFFLNLLPDKRKQFVKELKNCFNEVNEINAQNMNMVISLREDFYGKLGEFWQDIPEFNTESYHHYLKPLNQKEATDAIEKPLERMQVKIGYDSKFLANCLVPGLLQRSERESNKQIEPVHLQIVCNRLFKEVRTHYHQDLKAGKIVTINQTLYDELGGVERILQRYVELILEQHYSYRKQQDEVKSVLQQMVTSGGTREFKSVVKIAENINLDKKRVTEIIQQLDQSRLIETIPAEVDAERQYSITHEYLSKQINQWYTLNQLEEKRATELYERCLVNWKLNQRNRIPRSQLKFLQKYKPMLLRWKPEGKQLFRESEWLYHGLNVSVTLGIITLVGVTIATLISQRNAVISQVRASLQASEASFLSSNKELDALLAALRAGKTLKQEPILQFPFFRPEPQLMNQTSKALQQAFYNIREYNRLETNIDNPLPISGVSYSPNGKLIATASYDKTVKLWNYNGKLVKTLSKHKDKLGCVTFNSNGKLLASAGRDKTILWNYDGILLKTFPAHHDEEISYALPCVAFSPTKEILATTGYDKTVKIWNLDGKLQRVITGHTASVWGINFSPDSEILVSASRDGTVRFWNVNDGRNLGITYPNPDSGVITHVRSATFSKDGNILVTSADNGEVVIWQVIRNHDSVSLNFLKKINAFDDWALGASLSADGKWIASVSSEGEIKLWKIKGNLLETMPGHLGSALGVTFSADSKTLITTGLDGLVKFWSTEGYFLSNFGAEHNSHYRIDFSPSMNIIASASWESEIDEWTVKLWKLNGELFKAPLTGYANDEIKDISFSHDGKMLATAAWGGTVKVWNMKSLTAQNISEGQHFSTVSFSPDGNFLAHDYGRKIMLWKIREGSIDKSSSKIIPKNSYAHQDIEMINKLVFSPDSSIIASASPDTTIKLWSIEGDLLKTLTGHNDWIRWISFSPDGKLLASSSNDGTVKIWNLREGKLLRTLVGHDGVVEAVEFSTDGNLIASVGEDKTLRIWTKDGNLLNTLQGHTEAVYGVSFSPDSKIVASASWDGSIKTWSTETLKFDELLVRGCDWLHDYLKTNPKVAPADRNLCDDIPPPDSQKQALKN
ncbi:MAG: hypothetical protein F6K31_26270 [Symploca sp. SIO2G7]|nr:hypothetical protein [Symploca sp. SIO2G7]